MQTIHASELYHLFQEKPILIIDIREPYEHHFGHVPGCKNVPMNDLLTSPNQYIQKNEMVYIICQSGRRSAAVCETLETQGYHVINVTGGHNSWPGTLER